MSEKLKSFDRIKNYQVIVNAEKDEVKTISELLPSSCDEVETALKRLEELEKPKKIKGTITANEATKMALLELCPDVAKQLKAFEIIKEYFVLTSEYGKVSLELKKFIPENKLKELKEVLL